MHWTASTEAVENIEKWGKSQHLKVCDNTMQSIWSYQINIEAANSVEVHYVAFSSSVANTSRE
jgi:hypothetical protein